MTIKDIAQYCGVSVSTVSRALNGHPDVSDDVRTKVLDAVRELHYVPNKSARDLAMSQSDALGLVVRGATNQFYFPIMHAIEDECESRGYVTVARQIKSSDDEIREAAELVQSKRLKGAILLGGRFDYSEDDVAAIGAPVVCCSYTNDFGSLSQDVYSSVSINDKAEAYRATKALVDAGHTRIAILLLATNDQSISELRFDGYRQALADSGIDFDESLVFETGEPSMEAAYDKVSAAITSGPEFTAIFAIADTLAIAAMKAIYDSGASIPGNYSVVAIDGIDMSRYTWPTLSTFCQPQDTLGREAVKMLVDVIEQKAHNKHIRLEATPRSGGTIGSFSGNSVTPGNAA